MGNTICLPNRSLIIPNLNIKSKFFDKTIITNNLIIEPELNTKKNIQTLKELSINNINKKFNLNNLIKETNFLANINLNLLNNLNKSDNVLLNKNNKLCNNHETNFVILNNNNNFINALTNKKFKLQQTPILSTAVTNNENIPVTTSDSNFATSTKKINHILKESAVRHLFLFFFLISNLLI